MDVQVPTDLIPVLIQIPFVAAIIWLVLHRDKSFAREREQWREDIKAMTTEWRSDVREMQREWREEIRHMNDRFIEHSNSNREVLNRALDSIEKLTSPAELAGAISRRLDNPNRNRGRRREDRQGDE